MERKRFYAVALHGRNMVTLLYGLPPSGYAVCDREAEKNGGQGYISDEKTGCITKFKTAKAALISAALRNRAPRRRPEGR